MNARQQRDEESVSYLLCSLSLAITFQLLLMLFEWFVFSFSNNGTRSLVWSLLLASSFLIAWRLRQFPIVNAIRAIILALIGFCLVTFLTFALRPGFLGDDTFRATFAVSIREFGFPMRKDFWLYGQEGFVGYYVFWEYFAACLSTFLPQLSMYEIYSLLTKATLLFLKIFLSYTLVKEVASLNKERPFLSLFQSFIAVLALVFGAVAYQYMSFHALTVTQSSSIGVLVLWLANLVVRDNIFGDTGRDSGRAARNLVWASVLAVVAVTKFMAVPVFLLGFIGLSILKCFALFRSKESKAASYELAGLGASLGLLYLSVKTLLIDDAGSHHAIEFSLFSTLKRFVTHPDLNFIFPFQSNLVLQWTQGLFSIVLGFLLLLSISIYSVGIKNKRSDAKVHSSGVPLRELMRSPVMKLTVLLVMMAISAYGAFFIIYMPRSSSAEGYWLMTGWWSLNTLVVVLILSLGRRSNLLFGLMMCAAVFNVTKIIIENNRLPLITERENNLCHELVDLKRQSKAENLLIVYFMNHWRVAACNPIQSYVPPEHEYSKFASYGFDLRGRYQLADQLTKEDLSDDNLRSILSQELKGFKGDVIILKSNPSTVLDDEHSESTPWRSISL